MLYFFCMNCTNSQIELFFRFPCETSSPLKSLNLCVNICDCSTTITTTTITPKVRHSRLQSSDIYPLKHSPSCSTSSAGLCCTTANSTRRRFHCARSSGSGPESGRSGLRRPGIRSSAGTSSSSRRASWSVAGTRGPSSSPPSWSPRSPSSRPSSRPPGSPPSDRSRSLEGEDCFV